MNKKKIIGIIVIIILVLCVTSVVINYKDKTALSDNVSESFIADTIIVNDKIIEIQNSSQEISLVLPEFQNLESTYQEEINSKINIELNADTVYSNAISGLGEEEVGLFTYDLTYDRYNCGDYISIVANQYIHLGEGRPRVQKKCYVINAKENKTIGLRDIITDENNYKNAILQEINKQAENQGIELVGGNGLSELSDTQAFYIKDNKLIIYFESSEIAATAVGELEFEMPFEIVNNKFCVK